MQIYQKVYEDKQKLLSEIDNLNIEIKNLNQSNKVSSLENEVKQLQRDVNNYENALIKQEKFVNILKNKISKLEKQIIKKDEEIIKKENTIFELNDKINELTHKIQNIKEMFKIDSQKELLSKNDEIISLKNKIEINLKKMEFQEKKFQNLQYKYLRLLRDKKNDKDNLFFSFNENLSTVNLIKNKSKSNLSRPLNHNLQKNMFSVPNRLTLDQTDNNRVTTIMMDSIESINPNNKINNNGLSKTNNKICCKNNKISNISNINNINDISNGISINDEYNTLQNNQRYFSPKISLIKKSDNKDINNILPILNNDRNISIKKETKPKLKQVENVKEKNCIKKNSKNNWKELNKIIYTESNK